MHEGGESYAGRPLVCAVLGLVVVTFLADAPEPSAAGFRQRGHFSAGVCWVL